MIEHRRGAGAGQARRRRSAWPGAAAFRCAAEFRADLAGIGAVLRHAAGPQAAWTRFAAWSAVYPRGVAASANRGPKGQARPGLTHPLTRAQLMLSARITSAAP